MSRTFTPPTQVISPFQEQYNPAFGKIIKNKAHLREELSRYSDANGSELVEVGNEKMKFEKPEFRVDHESAKAELNARLGWKS